MSVNPGTRFFYSPSRGRITWREPSEADQFPLTAPLDWRPLVVIDPEDREQVGRVLAHYWHSDDPCSASEYPEYLTDLQAALRSLVEPPKPAEPTGLGAVVEDVGGRTWVRVEPAHADVSPWSPTWSVLGDDAQPSEYAEIAAVKVLAQGVSADV